MVRSSGCQCPPAQKKRRFTPIWPSLTTLAETGGSPIGGNTDRESIAYWPGRAEKRLLPLIPTLGLQGWIGVDLHPGLQKQAKKLWDASKARPVNSLLPKVLSPLCSLCERKDP